MSKPKQQHFVPQVYMRHFRTQTNSNQIYFYDKTNGSTGYTNIKNIAQEKDFYSDITQADKYYYENYYRDNIEPILGKLLSRIIAASTLCTKDSPLLSDNDRSLLSKMVAYQMLRTPSARILIREKADQVSVPFINQLLEIPQIIEREDLYAVVSKYQVLDDNTLKEISLPLLIDEMRMTKYISLFDTMICVFYDNQTEEHLITSDNPIIIYRLSTHSIGLGVAGLGYPDCIIVFPLNPRIAAFFVHKDSSLASRFRKHENRKISITQVETVRSLNRLQLKQANRQIYSQSPLKL